MIKKLKKMSIVKKNAALMWAMFIFAFTAGVYGGRTEEVFVNEIVFNAIISVMVLSAFVTIMFGNLFFKDFAKMVEKE